jgi:hypothetical protein
MNSLVKVPPYSKLNFQGKHFFTQNWCNITLNILYVVSKVLYVVLKPLYVVLRVLYALLKVSYVVLKVLYVVLRVLHVVLKVLYIVFVESYVFVALCCLLCTGMLIYLYYFVVLYVRPAFVSLDINCVFTFLCLGC